MGRSHPKGVPFQVYEKVGISLVDVYKKGRENCHFGLQKDQKGLTGDTFYGCERNKKTCWFTALFVLKRRRIYSS